MEIPAEHLEKVTKAAQRRLDEAHRLASLYATTRPLFYKRIGKGKSAVIVRLDYTGVLGVYDAVTGRPLALSEPGSPTVLVAGFVPSDPSQFPG